MATEIYREHVYGNFKPSKASQLKHKTRDKRADRDGNSEAHLANLRKCRCCIPGCRKRGETVHHLKATGQRGGGLRSPDRYGLPMCAEHHLFGVERAGSRNELDWFAKHGIEALELASSLWHARGSLDAMQRIVLAHRAAA